MSNKYIKPIETLNTDENDSFSYIRSYITFYYYIIIIKSLNNKEDIKKEFIKYYKNSKFFNFFYKTFIVDKNPLIFTYFNNIPIHFFPYIQELYYYYPYITFYNSKNNFYKKDLIYFKEKLKYRFIFNETFKISNNEIQITIPIKYFKNFKILKDNYIILKINNEFIITKNIKFKNNTVIFNNYYYKNNKKNYELNKKEKTFNFNDIEYVSVLFSITKKLLNKIFKYDIIKKNSIFYNAKSKENKNLDDCSFVFFYPKCSPKIYENKTIVPYCRRIKLIKDIKTLNLNIDIFYNNEIIKKLNEHIKYNYIDNKNKEYNTIEENEIFRCVNNAEKLKTRIDICNLSKKNFDYLNSDKWATFYHNGKIRKNLGKDFLNLLIFKNKLLTEYKEIYYGDFLNYYSINTFIYTYGYYFFNNKKKFYDTELFINNNFININDYFELIDTKKGSCNVLYKKGKLLNEKNIV